MRLIPDNTWAILTIWQEARGEFFDGKLAVAEVIRNRAATRYMSDGTIPGTVLRAYQFSGWNTQDPNRLRCAALDDTDAMVVECAKAWATAQTGTTTAYGAVCYYNPKGVLNQPAWVPTMRLVAVIGNHHFYAVKP